MKIIHTSDVHLDRCFAGAGMPEHFGNRRRQSLRDVFHDIVTRASEWSADALLIAGDLFDQERVTRDTVTFIQSELKSLGGIPVYISPGNHDPVIAESPYVTELWPTNVTIFREPKWTSVEHPTLDAVIHGFGFDGHEPSRNPFGELLIDDADKKRNHIAVAHGSERSHQPAGKSDYAPFHAKEAAVPGLNYLALGHFHSYTPITGEFSTGVCYAGSPEGLGFGETGMHHFLEIELENGVARINEIPSSRMVYWEEEIACDEFSSSQDVIEAVRTMAKAHDRKLIARIHLTGSCEPGIQDEWGLIQDAVSLEFEYLDLRNETAPAEDYDELAREETGLGLFVSRMNREITEAQGTAQERKLIRSRELGVAAFRNRPVEIQGLDRG
jgi:DNA repair exonuclease SbcCD nuclease subunit